MAIYSTDKAKGLSRDLCDRLRLRLSNGAGLNTVRESQDANGWPMLFLSHSADEAEGQPVALIRIMNIDVGAKDVFGNATQPFAPHQAQVACELNPATFIVSSANATAGAVYSNNGQSFTVVSTIASGLSLVASGLGSPLSSGTLTKVSGTGDATITYSAVSGLNPVPATMDYVTVQTEVARMGTIIQEFQIANGTAVSEASLNAASPALTLADIDWSDKGNV